MVELWLARHGETEWSAEGKHTSRTDVALTAAGCEMAANLGRYLAPTDFAAVFTSPMLRARNTCEIAGFAGRAVVDADLCEWDYGVFEGRTTREIQQEIPGWSVWNAVIEGGESLGQVSARADNVITRALAAAPSSSSSPTRILLFAHAHILRILAARWVGLQARGGSLLALRTGSVSVLGYERETPVIDRWDRTFDDSQGKA